MKAILLPALLVLFLVACNKETDPSRISYKLRTENRSVTVGRIAGAQINWTSGSAFAEKIEFEAERNDDEEIELERRITRRIDLFAPLTDLGTIDLAPGRYEEIELDIDLAPSANDTAFLLRGTFTNSGGAETPVIFFINEILEFEMEAEDVNLANSSDLNALTTLNLALLTTGISESQWENAARSNGVIVISKNSNPSLYNILLANINNLCEVEVDD